MVLTTTQRILHSLGYEVDPVSSGHEAIKKLEKTDSAYDLIISDQTMPEMSGKELADYLWSTGLRIPFLLCSGNSEGIGDSQGILKVLDKPISRSKFAEEISRVIA